MPWGWRTSTQVGRCSESVSASVPSRSKSRARYKALAPVEDHVQRAGDDEQRPDVQQDEEVTALAPLAQRASLVLGHTEDQGHGAQPPYPVEGEVPGEISGGALDRRPHERPGDEGRQRERDDEEHPVRPAPPSPGEPADNDIFEADLHERHVSSSQRKSGKFTLTIRSLESNHQAAGHHQDL